MRIDEAAIRRFLDTRYPRLVAGVALITGSHAAAEDAVQEALLRAWERSERGATIESLEAWVTAVALNLARSAVRRLIAERSARARMAAGGAARRALDVERLDIERALDRLPRRQREAVVCRYYLGMDTAEVAEVLRVTPGTVKSTLFRARAALAAALGEAEEQEANLRGAR